MTMKPVSPDEARRLMATGAKLVDVRAPDEHARARIPGAANVPLAEIDRLRAEGCAVIYHCRSGARTAAHADRLASAAGGDCYVIEGGIEAWRQAGLDVNLDRRQPLELMRQVQLAAGGLALSGVVLGFVAAPAFFVLSGLVGAGLMLAGATGWCGMARLLRVMPWNRRLAA